MSHRYRRLLLCCLATSLLFIVHCGAASAKESVADGSYSLSAYDDFSEPLTDFDKWWYYGEYVREIDQVRGKLVSIVSANGRRFTNDLWLRNPDTVASIEADVTLNAAEGDFDPSDSNKYTIPNARLTGFFYNDGTGSQGNYLGDVQAAIRLRSIRGLVKAEWKIWKGTSADGSTASTVQSEEFPVTITPGSTYRLSLRWDAPSMTFSFGVDGTTRTYQMSDSQAYLPIKKWKAIGTDAYVPPAEPSYTAYVSVTFDNVVARDAGGNVVMADDFSSERIDEAKWLNYETVKAAENGALRLLMRSSTGYTRPAEAFALFKNLESIDAIQADFTPLSYVNEGGALVHAMILSRFFNDGTSGGGKRGDISVWVGIGGTEATPRLGWGVLKHTSATDGSLVQVLAGGDFATPLVLGETYRLFLGWDGTMVTFRVDDEVATYSPSRKVRAPKSPTRVLDTRIATSNGADAVVEVLFDNVMTGVFIEGTPPALTIDSPRDGQSTTVGRVNVSGAASDENRGDSGIASVAVNGQIVPSQTPVPGHITFWLTTIDLQGGPNTITVTATDGNGNSTTKAVTVNYATAPTLSIRTPRNNTFVSTDMVLVSGTASDSRTGREGIVSVTVNGERASNDIAPEGKTASWNGIAALQVGENVITVVATDGGGRTITETVTVTRLADETGPALTIKTPRGNRSVDAATVLVSGTASDSRTGGNGIASVRVNGERADNDTAEGKATVRWSKTVTLNPDVDTITVVATDGLGNETTKTVAVARP